MMTARRRREARHAAEIALLRRDAEGRAAREVRFVDVAAARHEQVERRASPDAAHANNAVAPSLFVAFASQPASSKISTHGEWQYVAALYKHVRRRARPVAAAPAPFFAGKPQAASMPVTQHQCKAV